MDVPDHSLTRRSAVTGALAVPLLAACASDEEPAGPAPSSSAGATSTTAPSPGGSSEPAGGEPLTSTADIEVGGGRIFPEDNVVVTQPEEGVFKAFDATCTHQQCQVTRVSDGAIGCSCHGSRFSITDGAVEGGPARSPLPEVPITVANGEISLA